MKEISAAESAKNRDHMANERTFLAWIRTSLGIMAFGFVVERFALFLKQIALYFRAQLPSEAPPFSTSQTYSSLFGILLVVLGALIGLLSFLKYKKDEKAIEEGTYQSSWKLGGAIALLVVIAGIFLCIYLIES